MYVDLVRTILQALDTRRVRREVQIYDHFIPHALCEINNVGYRDMHLFFDLRNYIQSFGTKYSPTQVPM